MSPKITDKSTSPHNVWGDDCESWKLVESLNLSIKQESMPKGTSEKLHFHLKAQQFFFILNGTATFYLEDGKHIVCEQHGIHIEPKTNHFIANETNESIDFLVISQPTTNNDRTLVNA